MEVAFWQFLCKEGSGALPLKQRIPEVALFRGSDLEACYYSSQRGLLQRRSGAEASQEALLDRLLALAARRTDKADLGTSTPVAILRRAAGARAASTAPQTEVLSASEVLDLLERKGPGSRIHELGEAGAEWSLQSLAVPAEDLRVVVVYSRDPLGEERLDVVGRRYSGIYPLPDGGSWPASAGGPGASSGASAHQAVPPDQGAAAEAKTLALVRYVHRFYQRAVENLIVEFVVDSAGRVLLHGFWKASMFEPGAGPSVLEGLPEEESIAATVVVRPSPAFDTQSACSTATTAVYGHGGVANISGSRPTSAHSSNAFAAGQSLLLPDASRPTSAHSSNALAGGTSIQVADSVEDGGNDTTLRRPPSPGWQESVAENAASPVAEGAAEGTEADDSPERRCDDSPSGLEATARFGSDAQENLDIQDDDGEGDEVEDEIARMEATARPRSVLAGSADATVGGRQQQRPQPRPRPQPQQQQQQRQQRHQPPGRRLSQTPREGGRPLSARSRPAVGQPPPSGGYGAPQVAPPAPATARPMSGRSRPSSAGSSLPTRPSSATTVRPNSARPARPVPSTRPSTARGRITVGSVPARSRSKSAEQLQEPTPRSPRKLLESRQLISRYALERNLRPRLTSTLSRQLERYRELVPAWNAQKQAVQCAVKRKEQVAQQKRKEVEALVAERDETDRLYEQRYDALFRGMSQQQEKAAAQGSEVKQELERSQAEEEETTQALQAEDIRNAQLKSSLDQTMEKLNQVNDSMNACKNIVDEWANMPPEDPSPELILTLRQIEDTLKARDQIRSQARTIRAEVMLAQDELQRQRGYSTRMEEFVRRVSAGGGRYILHPASKREASRLLAAAAKLRAAAGLQSLDEEAQPANAG